MVSGSITFNRKLDLATNGTSLESPDGEGRGRKKGSPEGRGEGGEGVGGDSSGLTMVQAVHLCCHQLVVTHPSLVVNGWEIWEGGGGAVGRRGPVS